MLNEMKHLTKSVHESLAEGDPSPDMYRDQDDFPILTCVSRQTTSNGQTTPDDSSFIQGLCPHRPEKTTNSFIKITTS